VFGSPFFFLDGERFWGSDRIFLMVNEAGPEAAPARPSGIGTE
jgi:hypothetical protein